MARHTKRTPVCRTLRRRAFYGASRSADRHEAALYKVIFRSTVNGLALLAPSGKLARANPRMAQLLGLDLDAVEGRPLAKVFSEAIAREVLAAKAARLERPPDIEFSPAARPDTYLRLNTVPLRRSSGFPGFTLLVVRDSTEMARSHFRLVRELTFLSEVEALGREISGQTNLSRIARLVCEVAVGHSDLDDAVVVYREGGSSGALAVAGASFELSGFHRLDLEQRTIVSRVLETGKPVRPTTGIDEEASVWPEPAVGLLRACLGLPVPSGGEVVGVLVGFRVGGGGFDDDEFQHLEHLASLMGTAIRDAHLISEREERNAELQRTVARLQEAERAREQFYRFLIHDLNKPLAAIIGTADRLQSHETMPEKLRPRAERVSSAAHRLQDLVGKLLSYEQLRRGDLPMNQRRISLGKLVEEVVSIFLDRDGRPEIRLAGRPVEEGRRALPQIRIQADPVHFGRVIQNLVDNALEHAHTVVDVSISGIGQFSARLVVWNDGQPIAAEVCESVFSEFVRVPGTTRAGYGLGLAAARRIVEEHKGRISAEPAPDGNGTRFIVEVPALPESEITRDSEEETS